MQVIKERPWVFGIYQWIAFEHRGEAIWPRLCSQAGAIDLFLQKKDAFYQNKSIFTVEPMIHLLPHWNFQHKKGEIINVWAYTNCQEAELFLNGVSLGKKQVEKYRHVEWQVEYVEGTVTVIGYNNGEKACKDEKKTSGKAVKLMLKCENAYDVSAKGGDMALFTCYAVDENGIEVPDASPYVSFHTNNCGIIKGTGSDISDHIPVTCPNRKMRAGKISIGVEVIKAGELTLTAESEGLEKGYVKVEIK
jgi:beta-galactosidase